MAKTSVLARGFKTQAEKIAEDFRIKLKVAKTARLCAFDLAKFLTIPIASCEELLDSSSVYNIKNTFNAMWFRNVDGDKVIIHNTTQSPHRQQSNLMHELAHIIRDHSVPEYIKTLKLPMNLYYYNEVHEEEAKYLGGCLQLPRCALLWALKQGYSKDKISDYYLASPEMVQYRINATGVMRQITGWKN